MKNRIISLMLAMGMFLSLTTNVNANEKKIIYNSDGELVAQSLTLDAFENMAPGEERYETIKITNEDDEAAAFYIKQTTVATMEEQNHASGGAYQYDLLVGDTFESATSVLETVVGGYNAQGEGSEAGLEELTELEDWCYLTYLEPGESTYVFLSLSLDGEGNDNLSRSNYANSMATLELSFAARAEAQRRIQGEDEVIIQYRDKIEVVRVGGAAKTGDESKVWLFGLVFLAGIAVIHAASNKREKEEE